MKFSVIYQQTSANAQSPFRVVEQATGRGIGWINRYLDREYVRRLANTSLRIYAHNLLHFAIVGLMLLQGLRSAEVLALNRDHALVSEAQLRIPGKGNKFRLLPLAPETVQLLNHYLRLERPNPCSAALFVSLKGRARGTRMTAAGLRSLFRFHRQGTGIQLANPHRFRHYSVSRTITG
jgi:integrase